MRKLRELEDVLIRVESALAVVLVLVMLALAGYNVVYRNVLVPLQQHWAHSGPPRKPAPPPEAAEQGAAETPREIAPEPKPAEGGADDFGGFGGGLDEGGEPEPAGGDDFGGFGGDLDDEAKAEPAGEGADDFGGFGGGLDDEPEPTAKVEPETPKVAVAEPPKAEPAGADDFGGFGGGLGDDEPEPTKDDANAEPGGAEGFGGFGGFGGGLDEGGEAKADEALEDELGEDELGDELGGDDLGDDDQFANLAEIDAAGKKELDELPEGGPPPEGSFAAHGVAFIDAIKLDWIDVFLRQLVIIVSFLGAMLATQRGKHINIDALSKVLPARARKAVSVVIPMVAVGVCLVLANAGYELVRIGREYPKELLPWAEEWTLQLMFPVGFGLLALHFGVRVVEAALAPPDAPPPPPTPGPAPLPELERMADEDDPAAGADEDDAAASKGGQV